MNTYKVYWIDEDGFKGFTYIEAPTPKEARKRFDNSGYGGTISRVVKDC